MVLPVRVGAGPEALHLYIDPDGGLWLTEPEPGGGSQTSYLGNYTDAAARARVPQGMEGELTAEIVRIREYDAWRERELGGVDEARALERGYLAGLGDPQTWR